MSDFVFYLQLKPFVRQYYVHHYGEPVRFEPGSVSNSKIISVLNIRRGEKQEEEVPEGALAFAIPTTKQKDPKYWNFVTPHGKKLIIQHLEAVMLSNLWTEMEQMCSDDSQLQQAAYAWCEMHGISLDYADTIRMKYYREKKKFLSRGIDLRNKTRKRSHIKKI